MSIAEKLTTIAENEQKVYEAGKQFVYNTRGEIALFERYENEVMFSSLNELGVKNSVVNLYNVTSLHSTFKVDASVVQFGNPNKAVEHLTIYTPNLITNCENMLRNPYNTSDGTLERLTLNFDTVRVSSFWYAFYGLYALKTIDGTPIDLSTCKITGGMFSECWNLTDVRFKGSIIYDIDFSCCPKLSDNTVKNIIDCLKPLSAEYRTITFHGYVGGKLTDEQKATITAKNWTLAY